MLLPLTFLRWVLGDMLCNFHDILTIRSWLLIASFYQVYQSKLPSNENELCSVYTPTVSMHGNVPCEAARADAVVWSAIYLILLFTGCWQLNMKRWLLSAALPIGFVVQDYMPQQVLSRQSYLHWRFALFMAINVPMSWLISTSYRRFDQTRKRFDWQKLRESISTPRTWIDLFSMHFKSVAFLSIHTASTYYLDKQLTWSTLIFFLGARGDQSPGRCEANCQSQACFVQGLQLANITQGTTFTVLVGVLASCVVEWLVSLVVPKLSGGRLSKAVFYSVLVAAPPTAVAYSMSTGRCRLEEINYLCAACHASQALAWLLAILTALTISFGLFFFGASVIGFVGSVRQGGEHVSASSWRDEGEGWTPSYASLVLFTLRHHVWQRAVRSCSARRSTTRSRRSCETTHTTVNPVTPSMRSLEELLSLRVLCYYFQRCVSREDGLTSAWIQRGFESVRLEDDLSYRREGIQERTAHRRPV